MKIEKWYHSPDFHKFLYLGFIGVFLLHLLYVLIYKLKKKKTNRYNFISGTVDILNVLFLSLYFPAVMIIGMSPGMPAYAKGINALMLVVFVMPLLAAALMIYELIIAFTAKNNGELKKPWFVITVNILFFIWIIYWKAIFW